MKDDLGKKIMVNFLRLRPKTDCSLIDDGFEHQERGKDTKKCLIKRKLKFENHENCLRAFELNDRINYLERKEISINNLKKHHKEFIKKQ